MVRNVFEGNLEFFANKRTVNVATYPCDDGREPRMAVAFKIPPPVEGSVEPPLDVDERRSPLGVLPRGDAVGLDIVNQRLLRKYRAKLCPMHHRGANII